MCDGLRVRRKPQWTDSPALCPMLKFVITLAGAVALLLWGTYMVKTGILRTFGDPLRAFLATHLRGRFQGFAAGMALAVLLQSSTASALLVASLQAEGLVSTLVALSCVLGADLGSALVVRVVSLDLSQAIPVLMFLGVMIFLSRPAQPVGQFGRILLGLAFILLAIETIREGAQPLQAPEMAAWLDFVETTPMWAAACGAALALACFSSLAAVMIGAGAAAAGTLSAQAALWYVLGANVGSAFLAVITTCQASEVARRAPLGNALFRVAGFAAAASALTLHPMAADAAAAHVGSMTEWVVLAHLAVNAAMGLIGLMLLRPVAGLIEWLLPGQLPAHSSAVQRIGLEQQLTSEMVLERLRKEVRTSAEIFSLAWKELLDVCASTVPVGAVVLLRSKLTTVRKRAKTIDVYLHMLVRRELSEAEVLQWRRLNEANDALVLSARVMDALLTQLMQRKCEPDLSFSAQGLAELERAHARVAAQLERFHMSVRDLSACERSELESAAALAQAQDAAENFTLIAHHMERVTQGLAPSVETSALHVELLSGFRRIEGIVTTAIRNSTLEG